MTLSLVVSRKNCWVVLVVLGKVEDQHQQCLERLDLAVQVDSVKVSSILSEEPVMANTLPELCHLSLMLLLAD